MDGADWKTAAAANLVVMQVPGGAPFVVVPPGSVPAEPVARALLDIRCAFTVTLANLKWQYAEFVQKGLATPDRLREVEENNSTFFTRLACSDAVFHIAMEMVVADSDEPAKILSGIFSKCLAMGFFWGNPFGVGIRELVAAKRTYEHQAADLEALAANADPELKQSYEAVLRDVELRSKPIPDQLDHRLLGSRGAAFGDDESAKRGWFIRELNEALPPFRAARFAVIAQLLEIAGVTDVDATKVRAVLVSGGPATSADLP